MSTRIQPHTLLTEDLVAKFVLTPGDPGRVHKIAAKLERARKVAENRGFISYTGEYQGLPVTAVSSGIGCPSTAIVVEELARVGVQTIIRVGTTGGLQQNVDPGDLVIATGATRTDGTTRAYVSEKFPAIASLDVTNALISSAHSLGVKPHVGIVWTSDSYYAESGSQLETWVRAGVVSVEMECSALFTIGALRGLRTGAILAVDGNLVKGTKKLEFKADDAAVKQKEQRVQQGVDLEIQVALEAVKALAGTK